jgi:hypothetical protein
VPPTSVCGVQVDKAEKGKLERESIRVMKYLLRLWEIEKSIKGHAGAVKEGRGNN